MAKRIFKRYFRTMEAQHYHVDLQWKDGRIGILSSPELDERTFDQDRLLVATPPEFPKGVPGIWSPEHFFVASVASCLMTTFLAIADNSNLEFTAFRCKATGMLDQVEKRFAMTTVWLEPELEIVHEKDRGRALRILDKAEHACLITNSISSQVHMRSEVHVMESEIA